MCVKKRGNRRKEGRVLGLDFHCSERERELDRDREPGKSRSSKINMRAGGRRGVVELRLVRMVQCLREDQMNYALDCYHHRPHPLLSLSLFSPSRDV